MSELSITKYNSRRLFHRDSGRYLRLSDLRKFVRDGTPFGVVEHSTGRDVTRGVLVQIALDDEANGKFGLLTSTAMRRLIRLFGSGKEEFVAFYLEQLSARLQDIGVTAFAGDGTQHDEDFECPRCGALYARTLVRLEHWCRREVSCEVCEGVMTEFRGTLAPFYQLKTPLTQKLVRTGSRRVESAKARVEPLTTERDSAA